MLHRTIPHPVRRLATLSKIPTARPSLLEDFKTGDNGAHAQDVPMFTISRSRGFLPRLDPLVELPAQFAKVESLLQRMTIKQRDGSVGLLGKGEMGDAVRQELGNDEQITFAVDRAIASGDQQLISALFRDYSFLTSAYLLEPVDQHYRATGDYCQGREVLPRALAVPISRLAEKLGHYPFMEYASSYALQNFRRLGKTEGPMEPSEWATDKLRVIRAFQDIEGSEAGFILVHVSMVAHTGQLVSSVEDVLAALTSHDRPAFNASMETLYGTYTRINTVMDTMWTHSLPADYLKFRSFIFGTAGASANKMFPAGVVYEGVSDEAQAFRGESGANDSIVPMGDNLLEIVGRMPENELTSTLREFRNYRPGAQRSYLEGLEVRARELGVRRFAEGDAESLAWYILLVDQIREFRERHWRFTKSYIIARSSYQIATGGSPILDYLPQNLKVVLEVLEESCALLPRSAPLPAHLHEKVEACRERANTQRRMLEKDVGLLKVQAAERAIKESLANKREKVGGAVGCDGVG